MATPSGVSAVYATLSTTTVDTVTLTGGFVYVEILNISGSTPLYYTVAAGADVPATPTAAGADTFIVPAGTSDTVSIAAMTVLRNGCTVKIIGNGNSYGVVGRNT